MTSQGKNFFITTVLFLSVSILTTYAVSPFSFVNFIGPAAGVASALVVTWGAAALSGIAFAFLIYLFSISFFFDVNVSLPILLISLLAILLQSFWAKQLTYRVVRQQRWLKSRENLLFFLLKLGPLSSLVSAACVLIIIVLDNQAIEGSFFYSFMISWSGSMLVAIFITPMLLFTQGTQQLSFTKRLFVSIASILGALAIILLFKISQNVHQHQRIDNFQQANNQVKVLIKDEILSIGTQVKASSALFNASDYVVAHEFERFAQSMGLQQGTLRAVEWSPIVKHKNRETFEKQMSKVLKRPFVITEQKLSGELFPSADYDIYTPITYIYPSTNNETAYGLDLNSHLDSQLAMHLALSTKLLIASSPMKLVQDDFSNPGILVFSAVFSKENEVKTDESHYRGQGQLMGYVLAVTQFKSFFEKLTYLDQIKNVGVFVQDVTQDEPYIIFGQQLAQKNRQVATTVIDVFSRKWQITVAEKQSWLVQTKNWQTWAMVLGGTLGGLLFQLLILMMAAYSIELSHKVVVKTRELILAKEQSETKSWAKSKFLNTLNDELYTPINAIKGFTEQLRREHNVDAREEITKNIASTTLNMMQLLDTARDISNIESGNMAIKSNTFDFYSFLKRIETMLNADKLAENKAIFFLIDDNVPHFIDSDELHIQKLLVTLNEAAQLLFFSKHIRLSIKAHIHQQKVASIFFVFTLQDDILFDQQEPANLQNNNAYQQMELKSYSIMSSMKMTMVKELCQLLKGDVKYSMLPSGEYMLSASLKVKITSFDQQQAFQDQSFMGDDVDFQ